MAYIPKEFLEKTLPTKKEVNLQARPRSSPRRKGKKRSSRHSAKQPDNSGGDDGDDPDSFLNTGIEKMLGIIYDRWLEETQKTI